MQIRVTGELTLHLVKSMSVYTHLLVQVEHHGLMITMLHGLPLAWEDMEVTCVMSAFSMMDLCIQDQTSMVRLISYILQYINIECL